MQRRRHWSAVASKEQDFDIAKYYTNLMEAFNFNVTLADRVTQIQFRKKSESFE